MFLCHDGFISSFQQQGLIIQRNLRKGLRKVGVMFKEAFLMQVLQARDW